MPSPRSLSTAEERRGDVLAAAMQAFARGGYWGTNTTEVARAAGISQAYLYRLFVNKEELFVAVIGEVGRRLRANITNVLQGVRPGERLSTLLAAGTSSGANDRDASMVLLHAAAASSVKPVGTAVRQCYRDQVRFLAECGLTHADIRSYLAWSQYTNTLSAADVTADTPDPDLRLLLFP